MEFLSLHITPHFLQTYGYLGIFLLVMGESMGLALPGDTVLLAASVYAGKTHHLNIFMIVFAASMGAIIGDNVGFLIGYFGGYRIVRKYGKYIKVDDKKLKLGRYLFWKYGGRIVFFGRFIAILRILSALLAGINRMHWRKFLFFNALGGIAWASIDGAGGYFLGRQVHELSAGAGVASFAAASLIITIFSWYAHGHLKKLEKEAEKVMPGRLE